MGQVRGTKTDRVDAEPNACPDCGHAYAAHEGSVEDEFVASHGGVGYAICLWVDPGGPTTDPCGCRTVIGGSNVRRSANAEDNKATIRRLFDEVWIGDVEAADRFYAPGPQLDGLKEFATALYAAIPDWRVTIDDLVSEDDKVVVRWTGRGTHLGEWQGRPPTGRQVTTTGIDIERFADGKIVQEDGEVDMLEFLRQLGALPEPEGSAG